jgi:hypothetical protein
MVTTARLHRSEMKESSMDFAELSALLAEHKWLAALALFIGAMVRLLKSDTPLPWTVPAQWRSWLAVGLGVVGGVLDALVAGTPSVRALLQGLGAAAIAIAAHDTLVEGLRGGREWFASKTKVPPGDAPAGGSAGTIACLALSVTVAMLALGQPACTNESRQTARTVVDIASVSCVLLRATTDDGRAKQVCATEAELAPLVDRLLSARGDRWEPLDTDGQAPTKCLP